MNLVDTVRYPFHELDNPAGEELVATSYAQLQTYGSFSLAGFLLPDALADCVGEVTPLLRSASFRHEQRHDIYFSKTASSKNLTSSNYTLTCDQLAGTVIRRVYEWPPLCDFLARVFDKTRLYRMADPLARLNVMGYAVGDRLDWHFDRAQYTVTLLLQEAAQGGVFQYRRNLRSDVDPDHEGVARLLSSEDTEVEQLHVSAGTLNVFAGRFAAHCITPVLGETMRIVAVLSFVDEPDYQFSAQDRKQFYGRSEPVTV